MHSYFTQPPCMVFLLISIKSKASVQAVESLQHVEVPGPGLEPAPKLPPYDTIEG